MKKNITSLLYIFFLSTFCTKAQITPNCSQGYLVPGTDPYQPFIETGKNPTNVVVGDINNDGKDDFVVVNSTDGTISTIIAKKPGTFGFNPQKVASFGGILGGLVLSDLNGDKYLDLIITNVKNNQVIIAKSDEFGNFTLQKTINNIKASSIVKGDFNKDGKIDFATIAAEGTNFTLFLGEGGFDFTKHIQKDLIPYSSDILNDIKAADMNEDGYEDIVILNKTNPGIILLVNTTNNDFAQTFRKSNCNIPTSIALADFNNDGHPDIAIADASLNNVILLQNMMYDNNFLPKNIIPVDKNPNAIVAGDFNGDGQMDFATANNYSDGIIFTKSTVSIRYGIPGSKNFEFNTFITNDINVAKNAYSLAIGKFDISKRLCLIVSNKDANKASLLLSSNALLEVAASGVTVENGSDPSMEQNTLMGYVKPGKKKSQEFELKNKGTGLLRISNVSFNGIGTDLFTIENNPFKEMVSIKSGESIKFKLVFRQPYSGLQQGHIKVLITSDDCSGNYEFGVSAGFKPESKSKFIPLNIKTGSNGSSLSNDLTLETNITAHDPTFKFKGLVTVKNILGVPVLQITNARNQGLYSFDVEFGRGDKLGKFYTYIDKPLRTKGNFVLAPTGDLKTNHTGFSDISIGDFNVDGNQDLAIISSTQQHVLIFEGNGKGSFKPIDTIVTGQLPKKLTIGDFNGDGKQDLAITNSADNTVTIKLGKGDGHFKDPEIPICLNDYCDYTPQLLKVNKNPIAITYGDIDGDGIEDLVSANYNDSSVFVKIAKGDGTFRKVSSPFATLSAGDFRETFKVGQHPKAIAIADLDRNKKADVVTANANGTVSILFAGNDSTSTPGEIHYDFLKSIEVPTGSNPTGLVITNLNKDSLQDIITVNHNTTGSITVLLGNRTNLIRTDFTVIKNPTSIDAADFNGDGNTDIIVSNDETFGESMILFGNGNGSFDSTHTISLGNAPASLAVGDFNNDHVLDFATASNDNSGIISVRLGYQDPNPLIEISGNNKNIAHGSQVILENDNRLFSNVEIGKSLLHYYEIQNTGNDTLIINNINITTANANKFSLDRSSFPIQIAPSSTYSIGVKYTPESTIGLDSSLVSIYSNVYDPTPFEFKIYGQSIYPPFGSYKDTIQVEENANTIILPSFSSPLPLVHSLIVPATLKGILSINPLNGNINVTNAYPAGTYKIDVLIKGLDKKSFILQVGHSLHQCSNINLTKSPIDHTIPPFIENTFVMGDFDNDGFQDHAFIQDQTPGNISIIYGKNPQQANIVTQSTHPESLYIADINNDGYQDLIILNSNPTGNISIRINDKQGYFKAMPNLSFIDRVTNIAVGDVTHDGNVDLVCGGKNISILKGDGFGNFNTVNSLGNFISHSITLADINSDGNTDVVYIEDSSTISSFTGNIDGTFTKSNSNYFAETTIHSLQFSNIKMSADASIIAVGRKNKTIYVLNNNLQVTDSIKIKDLQNITSINSGDLNGDKSEEIIVTGSKSAPNLGNIWITDIITGIQKQIEIKTPSNAYITDLNKDSNNDLWVASSNSNIRWFLTDTTSANISISGNAIPIISGSTTTSINNLTDFNIVPIGNSVTHEFLLKNMGSNTLLIDSMVFEGNMNSSFQVSSPAYPFFLQPNTSIPLSIKYTSKQTKLISTTLSIYSNACNQNIYTFKLSAGPASANLIYPSNNKTKEGESIIISPTNQILTPAEMHLIPDATFSGDYSYDPQTGNIRIINAGPTGNHEFILGDGNGTMQKINVQVENENCDDRIFISDSIENVKDFYYSNIPSIDINNDGIRDKIEFYNPYNSTPFLTISFLDKNSNVIITKMTDISIYPQSIMGIKIFDCNKDGKKDLIVITSQDDSLFVLTYLDLNEKSNLQYINNPDFKYATKIPVFNIDPSYIANGITNFYLIDLKVDDLNNDQIPDLAIQTLPSNILLLKGIGTGTFEDLSKLNILPPIIGNITIQKDPQTGNNNIITTEKIYGGFTSGIHTYQNDGTGNFKLTSRNTIAPNLLQNTTFSDVNNDGIKDLIALNRNTDSIFIWKAASDGSYLDDHEKTITLPTSLKYIYQVKPYDYNRDGILDLLVIHGNSYSSNSIYKKIDSTKLSVLFGRADSTSFTDMETIASINEKLLIRLPNSYIQKFGQAPSIEIEDINNDTRNDILIKHYEDANAKFKDYKILKSTSNGPEMMVTGNNNIITPSLSTSSIENNTDFGNVNHLINTYSIENNGDSKLIIYKINLKGNDAASFEVQNLQLPLYIQPGEKKDIQIKFSAQEVNKNYSTELIIESNYCGLPLFKTLLSATSISPVLGKYADTTIQHAGGNITILPSITPLHNTQLHVKILGGYKGTVVSDAKTGAIHFTNAHPAGKYTVVLMADLGQTTSFSLQIGSPFCSNLDFYSLKDSLVATGSMPNDLHIVDFNNDAKQDILSVNSGSNNITLHSGNGDGSFLLSTNIGTSGITRNMATSDLNDDSYIDYALLNNSKNSIDVYINNTAGNFEKKLTIALGFNTHKLYCTDVNNDGKTDLITIDDLTGNVYVSYGKGLGFYTDIQPILPDIQASEIAFNDLNNDGTIDIILLNKSKTKIITLFGSPNTTFNIGQELTFLQGIDHLRSIDLNKDGYEDLVIANYYSADLTTYLNDTKGLFKQNATHSLFKSIIDISSGDYNGDGNEDISVLNYDDDEIAILPGNGDGTFSKEKRIPKTIGGSKINTADINADGFQDIIELNTPLNIFKVHFGNDIKYIIKGNDIDIQNNAQLTYKNNHTNFGIGDTTLKTFSLINTGNIPMELKNISISGPHANRFTLLDQHFPKTILTGDSVNIPIRYISNGTGLNNATIQITTNSCNLNEFNFKVEAIGMPKLYTYKNTSLPTPGSSVTINPIAPPLNIQRLNVYASENFLGQLTVDSATGSIHITNAHPAGNYTITVNAGSGIKQQFQLSIGNPLCAINTYKNSGTNTFVHLFEQIGDFNNDGIIDLIAKSEDGYMYSYIGTTDHQFILKQRFTTNHVSENVTITELNSDGIQDLVFQNNTDQSITICLGDGAGSFGNFYDLPSSNTAIGGTLGADINNDGLNDVMSLTNSSVDFYINKGERIFQKLSAPLESIDYNTYKANGINYADINADGISDLLLMHQSTGNVYIYFGNGKGKFGISSNPMDTLTSNLTDSIPPYLMDSFKPNLTMYMGGKPLYLLTYDLDKDGYKDIVTLNDYSNVNGLATALNIRFGNTSNSFGDIKTFIVTNKFPRRPKLAIADMNGDGFNEILITDRFWDTSKYVSIFQNNSTGSVNTLLNENIDINVTDVNKDGRFDIISGTSIYLGGIPAITSPLMKTSNSIELCLGANTNASNSIKNGVWISNNNSIATIDASATIHSIGLGQTHIKYIVDSVGCSLTDSILVKVKSTADDYTIQVKGKSNLCEKSTTLYTCAVTGGVWESSDQTVATINAEGKITGIKSGVATITYKVTENGITKIGSRIIKINALPTVSLIDNNGIKCSNFSELKVSGTGAYNIQWMNADKMIAQAAVTLPQQGKTVAGGNGAGNADNQITKPRSFDIDQHGNLYIVDHSNNRIQKWLKNATAGSTIYKSTDLFNRGIYGSQIAVTPNGTIYLLNGQTRQIKKMSETDTSGKIIADLTVSSFNDPFDFSVDASENVYTINGSMGLGSRVEQYSSNEIDCIKQINVVAGGKGKGSNLDQINVSYSIITDDSSNVYVGDYGSARITKFIPGDSMGIPAIYFPNIVDFQVDPRNNIYVSDYTGNKIIMYTPDINYKGSIIAGGNGLGAGSNQLSGPGKIKFDTDGNIYIADCNNNRIQRWDAPIPNPSYKPTESGDYKAIVTNFMGCSLETNVVRIFSSQPAKLISAVETTHQKTCANSEIEPIKYTADSMCTVSFNGLPTGIDGIFSKGELTIAGKSSITGIYNYNVHLTSNCIDTTINGVIEISENPLTNVITGNTSVCIGAPNVFSSSVPGGVWAINDPNVAYINNKGELFGLASGTATVIYTITQNGCKNSTYKGVNINTPISLSPINAATGYCNGNTVKLTAPNPSGIWSSSMPSIITIDSIGFLQALKPGKSTITYAINNGGCISSVSKEIQVDPDPQIIVLPKENLTTGEFRKLNYAATTGVWSSLNTNIATVDQSGNVTAISPGNTEIILSVFTENNCSATIIHTGVSVSNKININPIIGDSSICMGSTLIWSTSTTGGIWSSSNNNTATITQNGQITAIGAGTTEIYYTVNENGNSATIKKTLNVKARPLAPTVINQSICENAMVEPLIAIKDTLHQLTWYGNSAIGGTASNTSPAYTSSTSGSFDFYVSQTNVTTGCESSRAKLTVHIKPVPAQPTVTKDVQNNLISSVVNGNQWYQNGFAIKDATQQLYKPITPAFYSVVTNQDGCESLPSSLYNYFLSINAVNPEDPLIRLYPNPLTTELKIDFDLNGSDQINITIVDVNGRQVLERKHVMNNSVLNVRSLKTGIYFIYVRNPKGTIIYKNTFMKL